MRLFGDREQNWALKHYYVFIIIAGFVVYFIAGPVASTFQLSAKEYAIASELDTHGLQYKGRDFLDWRYGWLRIMFGLWYLALGLVIVGAGLGFFHAYRRGGLLRQKSP